MSDMTFNDLKDASANPIVQAAIRGETIQFYTPSRTWADITNFSVERLMLNPALYRIKYIEPTPPEGEEWNNPDCIREGIFENGHRLCLQSEMPPFKHGLKYKVQYYSDLDKMWVKGRGDSPFITYRTREPLPIKCPFKKGDKIRSKESGAIGIIYAINQAGDAFWAANDKNASIVGGVISPLIYNCYEIYHTTIVALEPKDIAPNAIFRTDIWPEGCYFKALEVNTAGILKAGKFRSVLVSFEALKKENVYMSVDDGKTWAKCEKEI